MRHYKLAETQEERDIIEILEAHGLYFGVFEEGFIPEGYSKQKKYGGWNEEGTPWVAGDTLQEIVEECSKL